MRLHGCCECRACTFQVALPAETVTRIDCHCPACRKHAAAAFVAWLPAPRRALTWGTSGDCEWRPSACEPARVRATCAGHRGAVDKRVCPQCDSVMALEPVGGEDVEVAIGPRLPVPQERRSVRACLVLPCSDACARAKLCVLVQGPPTKARARAGCIDDGDYTDLRAGRRDDDSKWPPSLRLETTARCTATRAPWNLPAHRHQGERLPSGRESPTTARAVSGSCMCGALSFELSAGMPREIQHCYCTQCRKTAGAPFVTWAPVRARDFKWTAGEHTMLKQLRSSWEAVREGCRACGSTLRMVYAGVEHAWQQPGPAGAGGGCVWPAVGALDFVQDGAEGGHPPVPAPAHRVVHICVSSKAPWVVLPDDGAPRLEYAFD